MNHWSSTSCFNLESLAQAVLPCFCPFRRGLARTTVAVESIWLDLFVLATVFILSRTYSHGAVSLAIFPR